METVYLETPIVSYLTAQPTRDVVVADGALPKNAADDALHIALAVVHGVEYLLTWNCRHIDNAQNKPRVRRLCHDAGYGFPEICTPEELMGGFSDGR